MGSNPLQRYNKFWTYANLKRIFSHSSIEILRFFENIGGAMLA